METSSQPAGTAGLPAVDPERPALEYLTLDPPRFLVETWRDHEDGWYIHEPGLHVTCRILGIPVATLICTADLTSTKPERTLGWTLESPSSGYLRRTSAHAIGDICEPGEGAWRWDDAITEIRNRLRHTSLGGACIEHWGDLDRDEDHRADEPSLPRRDADAVPG